MAETPRNKPANRNPQTPPFHRDGSPPTPDRAREKPPQRRPNRRLNPQKAHRRASSRLADIFAIQDEITQSVVGVIEPEMLQVEGRRAVRKSVSNLDAFDC